MATESLFTNIVITDPEKAERFADILDASAEDLKRLPPCDEGAKPIMTDPEELKKFLSRRFTIKE